MKNITMQPHFLKFEAVLAHCEQRVTEPALQAAMKYGRKMDFFDNHNKLSQSGELLAEILLPQYAYLSYHLRLVFCFLWHDLYY